MSVTDPQLLQELEATALAAINDAQPAAATLSGRPVTSATRTTVAAAAARFFAAHVGTDGWQPDDNTPQLIKNSARHAKTAIAAELKASGQPVGSFFVVWILPALLRLVFSALWNWWFSSASNRQQLQAFQQQRPSDE